MSLTVLFSELLLLFTIILIKKFRFQLNKLFTNGPRKANTLPFDVAKSSIFLNLINKVQEISKILYRVCRLSVSQSGVYCNSNKHQHPGIFQEIYLLVRILHTWSSRRQYFRVGRIISCVGFLVLTLFGLNIKESQ